MLNDAYENSGFQFSLHSVDRVNNTAWTTHLYGSVEGVQMKQSLAVDPASILDFYTCDLGGLLGYATFPWDYPEDSPLHGIVVSYDTLPGGAAFPYNEGDTATHEVGHYLGLYHTFQNGCDLPGDEVEDTPYEAYPAYGCPIASDSCIAQPGVDPIHNFMDYTDDSCMDEFTPGQIVRAQDLVALYKPTLNASSVDILHSFSLDTHPGWSVEGEWVFGTPLGQGGSSFGYADPARGTTGSHVFGVNLAGDYSTVEVGPSYLTTGPFDFSSVEHAVLRFRRWLNTDYQPYASASVEVSSDGVNWTVVWENQDVEITDFDWTTVAYDISAVADGEPTVYLRWGYSVGRGAYAYSGWNIDDVELLGEEQVELEPVYEISLDMDPGWSVEGEWEYGTPLGQGGEYGYSDPIEGATGSNVYGVNLAGDYATNAIGPSYLTTGPFDFSSVQDTVLRFQRWLNTDYQPYASASVEVSSDGVNWTVVWENDDYDAITDFEWTTVEYDISSVADGEPTVYLRWGYSVGESAYSYSGWNIDDVELLGDEQVEQEPVYEISLDTSPGWSVEGEWEYGTPLGQGGEYGYSDPIEGATGSNVYGVNLAGDYATNAIGPSYLTTGPFDFSSVQDTVLRFQRWLNTDYQPYASASVEVSSDGVNWTVVWENDDYDAITDFEWTTVEYDISSVADGESTVYLRWGYSVDEGAFSYSGWNIDDIELRGNQQVVAGSVVLDSWEISNAAFMSGEAITIQYQLCNSGTSPVDIGLGASIRPSTSNSGEIIDPSGDVVVTVKPGCNGYERTFLLPNYLESGSYSLALGIWDGQPGSSTWLEGTGWMENVFLVVQPPPGSVRYHTGIENTEE